MSTETQRTGKLSGFRDLLGYHVTTWREGEAQIVLDLDNRHMNGMGIVHGGLYATLLDAACGHAATWCAIKGNGRACVTVSLETSFLAPAQGGRIIASGRLVGQHERMAVCRAEIMHEAGALLALGQGSFRYAAGSERREGVPRGLSRGIAVAGRDLATD